MPKNMLYPMTDMLLSIPVINLLIIPTVICLLDII
jgi:hypothetical protein